MHSIILQARCGQTHKQPELEQTTRRTLKGTWKENAGNKSPAGKLD